MTFADTQQALHELFLNMTCLNIPGWIPLTPVTKMSGLETCMVLLANKILVTLGASRGHLQLSSISPNMHLNNSLVTLVSSSHLSWSAAVHFLRLCTNDISSINCPPAFRAELPPHISSIRAGIAFTLLFCIRHLPYAHISFSHVYCSLKQNSAILS